MLSKLSKLATKRILKNIKCKKLALVQRSKRTYLTSSEDAQRYANRYCNAIINDHKTNSFSSGELSKFFAEDMTWCINKMNMKGRTLVAETIGGLLNLSKSVILIPKVYQWSPHGVSFTFVSRSILHDGTEFVTTGVNFHSLNDEGLTIAFGTHDLGGIGPYDEEVMDTILDSNEALFDTRDKAQAWIEKADLAIENDVNNGNSAENSEFMKLYAQDGIWCPPGQVLSSSDVANQIGAMGSAIKKGKLSHQLNSYGPYSVFSSLNWSFIYNDGEIGTWGGSQLIHFNQEGKVTSIIAMMNEDQANSHFEKVQSLL